MNPKSTYKVKILHLEDDSDWRDIVQSGAATFLRDVNYETYKGSVAGLVTRASGTDRRPLILIFDLRLGDFHSQYESVYSLVKKLWKLKGRRVSVFILSGYISDESRHLLERAGIPSSRIFDKGDFDESLFFSKLQAEAAMLTSATGALIRPVDYTNLIAHLNSALTEERPQEKGKALEIFMRLFFAEISGFSIPHDGVGLRTSDEEIDVLVEVVDSRHHLQYGTFFICECKNWKGPVAWDELSKFHEKLVARRCKFGVFVALNGVTSGFHSKKKSFLRDGTLIALLTVKDLRELEAHTPPEEILRNSYYSTLKYSGEAE